MFHHFQSQFRGKVREREREREREKEGPDLSGGRGERRANPFLDGRHSGCSGLDESERGMEVGEWSKSSEKEEREREILTAAPLSAGCCRTGRPRPLAEPVEEEEEQLEEVVEVEVEEEDRVEEEEEEQHQPVGSHRD